MSLASLIATGTKVWLDGVEPDEIEKNRAWGITGATSNPTIVSKIIGRGHFDGRISELIEQGLTDDQIAWELDDELVKSAQQVFLPVWERTEGNDGYVSFELDPLIEDEAAGLDSSERVRRYLELGEKWSAGHKNRMIKVPASAAGLDALGGACRRRRHDQCDADVHRTTVPASPVTRSGAARSVARTGFTISRASTASSCLAWTFTRRNMFPT